MGIERVGSIDKPQWVLHDQCGYGLHCASCRDPGVVGESFRSALAHQFALPDDAPLFTCPHGKPWRGAPISVGVSTKATRSPIVYCAHRGKVVSTVKTKCGGVRPLKIECANEKTRKLIGPVVPAIICRVGGCRNFVPSDSPSAMERSGCRD